MEQRADSWSCAIPTEVGQFVASFSEHGLKKLDFPTGKKSSYAPEPRRPEWVDLTKEAIEAVLGGEKIRKMPPLDLESGSEFQRAVWKALQGIPPGSTLSYGEVARQIGKPGAARAVGRACGANPVPLLVPCHRVLAGGSQLGGFSAGLDWKKRLLGIEKVSFKTSSTRR